MRSQNKQQRNKKEEKYKTSNVDWLLLCLSCAFMFCIFAPLDVYFANKDEYWFSLTTLLPVVLAVFVFSYAVLAIAGLLLNRTQASPYLFVVLSCLLLFFYIQGNYIPRNYGVLNGVEINWSQYEGLGIASLVLAIFCAALGVLMIVKLRKHIFKIGKYIALFLLAIQLITLSTTLIQKELLAKRETQTPPIVTNDKLFELSSSGENIVFFLLDTFDGDDMRHLLEQDGDSYAQLFEDFTYYPDTLGAFPTTKGAVPYILSGVKCDNTQPYTDYVRSAYRDNDIQKVFRDKGYAQDVYTNNRFVSRDEGTYRNIFSGSYRIGDYPGFTGAIYRLVAFNYMPHQAKRFFVSDTESLSKYRTSDVSGRGVFSEDVQLFYEMLTQNGGFDTSDSGNLFKFYHLEGVHPAYTFDESLQTAEGKEYSSYTEAAGNFALLQVAFDDMKHKGLYDNSAIVILADHGHINHSQNPLFMVKNPGESHEFRISDVKMSYIYMRDVFMALIAGEDVNERISECTKDSDGGRMFYYYSWDENWDRNYLPNILEMKTEGVAWDDEALQYIGVEFIAGDTSFEYELATQLTFNRNNPTASTFFLFGFSGAEETGTWTDGHEARMRFDLNEKHEDLKLTIGAHPFYTAQHVSVLANGTLVDELVFDSSQTKSLIIPGELITEDTLILSFKLPDASRPIDVDPNNKDPRMLALFISSLSLESVAKGTVLAKEDTDTDSNTLSMFKNMDYTIGETIYFAMGNATGAPYCESGFSVNEAEGIWTEGNEAVMHFKLPDEHGNLRLSLTAKAYHQLQHVVFLANGHEVGEVTFEGVATRELLIPEELMDGDELVLTMQLPDAIRPVDVEQDNCDGRTLALYLQCLCLERAE